MLDAYRRDRRKDALLQQNGYFVLRFLTEDAGKRLDQVLDAILAASRSSRKPPGRQVIQYLHLFVRRPKEKQWQAGGDYFCGRSSIALISGFSVLLVKVMVNFPLVTSTGTVSM